MSDFHWAVVAFGFFVIGILVGIPLGRLAHRKLIIDQFREGTFFALPAKALAAQICISCLEPFDERVTERQIAVAQCAKCIEGGVTLKEFRSQPHAEG
jgi:hypothetical protein